MSDTVEENKMAEAMKVVIPMTEDGSGENSRRIPKVVFIENTEAWVEKYTDDAYSLK